MNLVKIHSAHSTYSAMLGQARAMITGKQPGGQPKRVKNLIRRIPFSVSNTRAISVLMILLQSNFLYKYLHICPHLSDSFPFLPSSPDLPWFPSFWSSGPGLLCVISFLLLPTLWDCPDYLVPYPTRRIL